MVALLLILPTAWCLCCVKLAGSRIDRASRIALAGTIALSACTAPTVACTEGGFHRNAAYQNAPPQVQVGCQ